LKRKLLCCAALSKSEAIVLYSDCSAKIIYFAVCTVSVGKKEKDINCEVTA
jgi:hypothetical protein